MSDDLQARFSERFGGTSALYRAPGRVNLIGEHTDYNEGYVMPVAIGLSCWVAIGRLNDHKLAVYSENLNESVELSLANSDLHPSRNWSDYPLGVAKILQRAGYSLRGANLYIRSAVPLGAGRSSSGALEVSVGYALLRASGHDIQPVQLALLCQRAENELVGARCGIMDQFTACHGQTGNALMLDCRSLEYRWRELLLHPRSYSGAEFGTQRGTRRGLWTLAIPPKFKSTIRSKAGLGSRKLLPPFLRRL